LHFTRESAKINGMKRLFLPVFVFLLLAGGAEATELEIIAGLDGLTFHPDKTEAYTDPDTDSEFKQYSYGLVNISVRHDISEILNLSVNIERDNILQNSINAIFGAKTDYFNFKFGVFMGLTDNFDIPDAGITGNMELIIPGIVSLAVSGSSTLGSRYDYTGDNYRETAGIKLGFWLGSATPSFSANIKNLSRQIDNSLVINDTLLRFLFNFEYFLKNANFSGYLCTGYQIYTRSYRRDAIEYCDELNSWLAGFGFGWQITRTFCFKTGFEVPINLIAVEPMTASPKYLSLSRIYAGFIYSFNK
jgi:hypothetical protein